MIRMNRNVTSNLVLRIYEICAQNRGNSISGDLTDVKIFWGDAPRPPLKGLAPAVNNHFPATVEPRFNEPLYNEVLGITNDILQPGQSYSKKYGTEPRFNGPRYNEVLFTTNTIEKPKHKIYPDITNKCHHATKDECETDEQR